MTVDSSGNLYMTGDFYAMLDFAPSPAVYNLVPNATISGSYPDEFVTKLDANGNFNWTKQLMVLTIKLVLGWF